MHGFWAKFALFVRELQNQLTNSGAIWKSKTERYQPAQTFEDTEDIKGSEKIVKK